MTHYGIRHLLAAMLLATLRDTCPAQKLVKPLLSINSVVMTLRNAGLAVDAQQIAMPPGLIAAEEQPALTIESAELQPGGSVRVRLNCNTHTACRPFYVAVSFPTTELSAEGLATLWLATAQAEPAPKRMTAVLRPGEQTSLVLEDRQMRINLPVIAIDSGSIGTEVRVVSLDHKTTFRTVVVSPTLVRGVLP